MAKYKTIIIAALACFASVSAQTPQEQYERFRNRARQQYENFRDSANKQYESFRDSANRRYADFMRQAWAWQTYQVNEPIPTPQPLPVPPVVVPEEDRDNDRKDEQRAFDDMFVINPPKPQPTPIEPVKPIVPISPRPQSISTTFYGTRIVISVDSLPHFELDRLDDGAIADSWEQLSGGLCDGMLSQCLELRQRLRLNDWGYIQLLDSVSRAVCMKRYPEPERSFQRDEMATMLMAWLYCQSGYMMRLGYSKDGILYMLFASDNIIYGGYCYFTIDGVKFYPYKKYDGETMTICKLSFPKEQTMTLVMNQLPLLENRTSTPRELQSKRYPAIKVSSTVNKNLIDFYNNYPTGSYNNDFGTRWAIYANTPLSDEAQQMLYPQLKTLLTGKSKLEATEELLNLVQTALVYEYDDTVWGGDRAFFAEESLYYPYADCEDHAILFSRLVRDLVGLKVVLIYYDNPCHLATAVRFEDEQPKGDYLELEDGRYYIADPTFTGYGAPVGRSMPCVENAKIKVIVL